MIAPRTISDPRLLRLLDAFSAAGCEVVEPAILQPAADFLDTAGEDLAGRLFTTQGADGRDLCLRADYTIPVCRLHLENFRASEPASYAYCGRVFRQRPNESGEFLQAGIELLGDPDREAADARALALASEALALLNAPPTEIVLGDEGLFACVVEQLGLSGAWVRRLRRAFGDRAKLDLVLRRLASHGEDVQPDSRAGVLAALSKSDHDGAVRLVEDLIAIAGVRAAGGRTAHEIAERFLDQASPASSAGRADEIAAILRRFLEIDCPAGEAMGGLERFGREQGLDLSAALAAFQRRMALADAAGIPADRLRFSAEFGRNLDYYTGLVFEMRPAGREARPLIGGGRYDGLLSLLGAPRRIPAVGFSIWLDRLGFGETA